MTLSIQRPLAPPAVMAPGLTATTTIAALQQLLADGLDLCSQVEQAHWTVRGPNFMAHHLLFDELADRLRLHVDEIAARCAALGGSARGTARAVAALSRMPEYPDDLRDGPSHIAALVERYGALCTHLRGALAEPDTGGDPATQNLLGTILRALELDLWKLESHRE